MLKNLTIFIMILYSSIANADVGYDAISALYSQYFNKTLPKIDTQQSKEREPTLFFFTSTSVPQSTLNNYFYRANKLNITSYAVYRGLNNDVKKMLMKANKKEKILVKIHPLLFTDLKIEKVPVIVFANCPDKNHFKYKECEYLYRIDGDISLNEFFEKVSDDNKYYKKYSEILNGFE